MRQGNMVQDVHIIAVNIAEIMILVIQQLEHVIPDVKMDTRAKCVTKVIFLVYLTNINIRYHFSVLQLSMSIQFSYCQELVVISKDGNLKFDL